jgi:ADP-ribose pyrophosphatase
MPVKNSRSPDKVVSSRTVYRGPVFTVTTDYVLEPGVSKPQRRDIVRHQGSAVVLAVDESRREPRVLLARQYRHAAGRALWELPAGRIDRGETALAAAKRELREETGFAARCWQRALLFYSSPGFLDEAMAVYLARDLHAGTAEPEEDEVISLRFFTLSQAVRMAEKGRLQDSKTIAGVLWLARRLRR